MTRYMIRLPTVTALSLDDIVETLAPALRETLGHGG
ncbi:hypothetical protein P2L57_23885 [Streptomyces ferralitis]|uniref:Uncharacterized protein n=1 Tax=Streptantibioticus ferralitis TaxID=236510 RepID=A0ABT5Z496_9ACTN|nr:hypothetical protein [Streptantibioticus ferralitis]MDF2258652.1 hypothetical protein [Streptantibioticus ferralitis]